MKDKMLNIKYSSLEEEAKDYWKWHMSHPILPMDAGVAKEGAGSELRSPLFHYGTVLPVYLGIIRYLRGLKNTKGLKLVELGSGSGRVLSYLQSLFPYMEIWGTDYSKDCISYAQRAYGQYGVHFVHDSAQRTTLKAGSMDFVISSHVIEHVTRNDGSLFLKECLRLLKKDGIAFVGTPERRNSQDLYMKNLSDATENRLVPPHEHEYTHEELNDLAVEIFGKSHVKVDKLYNPVFRKIFSSSVSKFRPGKKLINQMTNFVYRKIRDNIPKLWFDFITKNGAKLNMVSLGITYKDILLANKIEVPKSKAISDNLLLVAQK